MELFAERVVEAQIHLEDCLSNIEAFCIEHESCINENHSDK